MVQLGKRVGAGAATLCILCSVILSVLTVQFASFFLGEGPPFIWFIPAVLVTAYFAGLIPGLIATVLSALVVSFNFLRPVGSFWI